MHGCPAGSGDDTIILNYSPGLSANAPMIQVTTNTTIQGASPTALTTITGDHSPFSVGPAGQLAFVGVKLTKFTVTI